MLIALTIMVFLILVFVMFGFNDNSKKLGGIMDNQKKIEEHLEQIRYHTQSIK
jgi:hypothetical protein